MIIPDRIKANWIATLEDEQLIAAEAELHADFQEKERTEKDRTGPRYILLQGPAALVNAWQRWLLLSNETRCRGLVVRRRPTTRAIAK
jgi:hypothetical protein